MNVFEHLDSPECGPILYRIFDLEDVMSQIWVLRRKSNLYFKNTVFSCDIQRIVIYVFALDITQFSAPKFVQIWPFSDNEPKKPLMLVLIVKNVKLFFVEKYVLFVINTKRLNLQEARQLLKYHSDHWLSQWRNTFLTRVVMLFN